MPRPRTVPLIAALGAIVLLVQLAACSPMPPPTATPDYTALETEVAVKLAGTLTAKAPTPTVTPTRTATRPPATPTPKPAATQTPTFTPTPSGEAALLAYVRVGEDQVANLYLYDLRQGTEELLTHFAEPLSITDVSWSSDGQWISFVSAHDYIHSRNNERNVFVVRADGTDLHMITGDYVEPDDAPGPYTLLSGQIEEPVGTCLVCAQGVASPASAAPDGRFELAGVPVSARWARAVCQQDDSILQGDVWLELEASATQPITITLAASGQGWNQAAIASDTSLIAGTVYTWSLDADGVRQIAFDSEMIDAEGYPMAQPALPEGSTILGVDWSPISSTLLIGALTDEKGAGLYAWTDAPNPEPLVRLENPEDMILSTAQPAWSPTGKRVAFELRQWSWWGENRYRTVLVVWDVEGDEEPWAVVEPEWGQHAAEPSWSADGSTIYYQLSSNDPSIEFWRKENGDIYAVRLSEPTPVAITQDGRSYLPAARPPVQSFPKPPTATPQPVMPEATASPAAPQAD